MPKNFQVAAYNFTVAFSLVVTPTYNLENIY